MSDPKPPHPQAGPPAAGPSPTGEPSPAGPSSPAGEPRPSLEEVERLLARMGREEVPDPGSAYWAVFPARVRARLAASSPARTALPWRWPVWGALAAGLLLVLVWVGMPGSRTGPAAPTIASDRSAGGDAGGGEQVEEALDTLLGAPDLLQVDGRLDDLSTDEKLELLDILRRELDELHRRGDGDGDGDGKPA